MTIESVGLGFDTPQEARERLIHLDRFVSIFCGVHARIATQNRVYQFVGMSDEQILEVCKKVCEDI